MDPQKKRKMLPDHDYADEQDAYPEEDTTPPKPIQEKIWDPIMHDWIIIYKDGSVEC